MSHGAPCHTGADLSLLESLEAQGSSGHSFSALLKLRSSGGSSVVLELGKSGFMICATAKIGLRKRCGR